MKASGFAGFVLLSLTAASAVAADPVPTPPPPQVAVKAGRLIDVKAGAVVANAVVLIQDGRVKAVGPSVAIPAGATVIDLSGYTVLPGLIDCHTHLVADASDADPLSELKSSSAKRAFESVPNARVTLEAGFTTVRDVGSYRAFVDVALRDAIAKGAFPGPRMYVAGPYVTITGGGGTMSGGLAPDIQLPWDLKFGVADGVDQVRQRVRDIAQNGVDLIKVLATGAFLTHGSDPKAVEYSYDELRAAVEEAAHKGLKVAAHAHSTEGIKSAVRAGVASIEHGTYVDDEGLRLMKEKGTYLVADIYDAEWIRRVRRLPGGFRRQAARGRRDPASELQEGRADGREDRVRHGRRRLPSRVQRPAVRMAGQVRADADGGHPLGDDQRRRPHRTRQRGRARSSRASGPTSSP